jgi:uncharacterized ferritin-like protein (DUF455 family)
MELRRAALAAFLIQDPVAKAQAARACWRACAWDAVAADGDGKHSIDRGAALVHDDASAAASKGGPSVETGHHQSADGKTSANTQQVPGRPARPMLVDPRTVAPRAMGTPLGRATLLHAVAHIEFNAINLALDACWRFADMPRAYYADWMRVAAEEALHFTLVNEHLHAQGWRYGDFDAHSGLWDMAELTRHDVLARMALVPRIMEARGLDVTPAMQQRFAQAGDQRAADILGIILHDEVGHVAIGNHWYRVLCEARGLDTLATMHALMQTHRAPRVRLPLNVEARLRAGFSHEELNALTAQAAQQS